MIEGHTVAVLMPALNEAESLPVVLTRIPDWVDDVVVCDNGSTDETASVARRHGARVVAQSERGYGVACLTAIDALAADQRTPPEIVVFLDADGSDEPQEMRELVAPILDDEAEMVIGSRVARAAPGALTPQARFGNWLATALIRGFWREHYTDLGPFRAIRYDTLQRLGMRDRTYGWTVEMQVKAAQQSVLSTEIPVSYKPRHAGRSKVSGSLRGIWGAGTKILGTIFDAKRREIESVLNRDDASDSPLQRGPATEARLIIFAKVPEAGAVKTRLIPALGAEGAAKLHKRMVAHNLDWTQRLSSQSLTVELCFAGKSADALSPHLVPQTQVFKQGGGDLGARLARATRRAFRAGHRQVIFIGTDCLQLTPRHIAQVTANLADGADLVYIPAHDGGYTLIGLARPLIEVFAGVNWGTERVLEQSLRIAGRLRARVVTLEPLSDIDRPEDLHLLPATWQAALLPAQSPSAVAQDPSLS